MMGTYVRVGKWDIATWSMLLFKEATIELRYHYHFLGGTILICNNWISYGNLLLFWSVKPK